MEMEHKKRAASLGIHIGLLFLMAVVVVVLVAYYVLSQNFHNLLTDYTLKLIQAMADQGVRMVEMELETEQKEAVLLAGSFQVPAGGEQAIEFPQAFVKEGQLRLVYVTETGTVASDGRQRDIRERRDIRMAFSGETAIYGPYFNEEDEFVICYSAPVREKGDVVGVLSIEKDGYRFCDLIGSIQFADSGESYMINEEGTDIAVSDPEHINWVTEQYNSKKIFEAQGDQETKSILELEEKGLNGESGRGTYYWEGGLCYVVYVPIPSVNWVFLVGLREEEIASMTQSAFFSAVSKGPALGICLSLFFLLTCLIVFWIVSSMKKNAEINDKLEVIANHDSLTGLLNRRFLETSLTEQWKYPIKIPSQAAVFMMDIDNFKQYNDFYGHPRGDDCLREVANILKDAFEGYHCDVMRYGGEEFIAAIFLLDRENALALGQKVCRLVEEERLPSRPDEPEAVVTVSVGVCYIRSTLDASLFDCIRIADQALYKAKKDGKNRAVLFDALPDDS